jgi:hypothetical protein
MRQLLYPTPGIFIEFVTLTVSYALKLTPVAAQPALKAMQHPGAGLERQARMPDQIANRARALNGKLAVMSQIG